jgi:hypothetical protein
MAFAPEQSSATSANPANMAAAQSAYFSMVATFQDLADQLRAKRQGDGPALFGEINRMIALLREDERMFLSLANAPYSFLVRKTARPVLAIVVIHGVNVMVYSLKISRDLGVPEKRLPYIGMAALCHNLGLLSASDDELKRFSSGTNHAAEMAEFEKLTPDCLRQMQLSGPDFETIESLLSFARNDEQALSRTSMHETIYQYAMIIHVCCVFEQLTHQRTYGEVLSPVDALKKMRGEMKDYFHPEIIKLFFNHLSIYPLGSFVKLNSRETAKIVALNPGFIMRPVVSIVLDEDGQEKSVPVRINLRDKPNLYIKQAFMDDALTEKYIHLF